MNTHADKSQENKNQTVANKSSQMQNVGESTFQFVDNRVEAVAQRKLQGMANNSPRAQNATQLQTIANNNSIQQQQAIPKNGESEVVSGQGNQVASQALHVTQLHSDTIQMAGHAEDLCFVGRWLVKRADSTEINQYVDGETPSIAPNFSGPFYTADEAISFLQDSGENVAQDKTDKINLMAQTMSEGGKGFMILANATSGMTNPEMRDLKMGKHSASGTDQERHGITGLAKVTKIVRHNAMDYWSSSSERGYRDEDRWKLSKMGDNTDELQRMLDRASRPALAQIDHDLAAFRLWLNATNVVYVGMSLLIVSGSNTGKAVAIDFEHPIRDTDPSFNIHKDGIVVGVDNIRALVADYDNSYDDRARKRETERRQRAEEDRIRREALIKGRGGQITGTGEGNLSIGNDDL
ncbi:MAG TPA: hypothetical protein VKA27_14175 [Sunxiuqinia sp.]|nr:hypothetical protein [Sunxiuqinia sp.]